jgi:predicted small metal-binding protein
VVRRAVEHLKSAHGETTIRENMVDNIKARIRDEVNAA